MFRKRNIIAIIMIALLAIWASIAAAAVVPVRLVEPKAQQASFAVVVTLAAEVQITGLQDVIQQNGTSTFVMDNVCIYSNAPGNSYQIRFTGTNPYTVAKAGYTYQLNDTYPAFRPDPYYEAHFAYNINLIGENKQTNLLNGVTSPKLVGSPDPACGEPSQIAQLYIDFVSVLPQTKAFPAGVYTDTINVHVTPA